MHSMGSQTLDYIVQAGPEPYLDSESPQKPDRYLKVGWSTLAKQGPVAERYDSWHVVFFSEQALMAQGQKKRPATFTFLNHG